MVIIKYLHNFLKKPLLWLLLFFSCPAVAWAQSAVEQTADKTRLLFVLDASGSMLAPWDEGNRMEAAKRLLTDIVDSLRTNPHLELGLRVYGHQADRHQNDCLDSKLEVAFAEKNHEQIIKTLQNIQPKGNTPLAYSLEQSAQDFPDNNQYRNIIILITDGIESCGGDPCAVSLALQQKGVFLKPFVIALSQEAGMPQQFSCLGDYYDASSLERFKKALNLALKQSLGKTTLQVKLLDAQENPLQTNLNISFLNSATGEAMYHFFHFLDKQKKPDTLSIDPVPTYNVVVHTLPPVVKKAVRLEGGKHHVLTIKAPEGKLHLQQQNYQEYSHGVQALLTHVGQQEILHVQPMGSEQKYLEGTYTVEVLTLPRHVFKEVRIAGDETTTLSLPAPGVLNIRSDVASWQDLYLLKDGQIQELILHVNDKNSINSLALQPGDYRLVYRAKNAKGSKFTEYKDFTITSGKTLNLNLFGR